LKWKEDFKFVPLKSTPRTLIRVLINFISIVIFSFPMFIIPKTASIPVQLFFRSFIGPFMAGFAGMLFTYKINKFLKI